jgi:hypothetical protein
VIARVCLILSGEKEPQYLVPLYKDAEWWKLSAPSPYHLHATTDSGAIRRLCCCQGMAVLNLDVQS